MFKWLGRSLVILMLLWMITAVACAQIDIKLNAKDPVGIEKLNAQITLENWTFDKGQQVQFRQGWRWVNGVIQQVHGELYLVVRSGMEDDKAHWHWMRAFNIRENNQTSFKGMVRYCHIQMTVGNDDLQVSLDKAKKRLQYLVQTYGTDYASIADTHQNMIRISQSTRGQLRMPVTPLNQAKTIKVSNGLWTPMLDQGPALKPVFIEFDQQLEWDHQRSLQSVAQQGINLFWVTNQSTCVVRGGYLADLKTGKIRNTGQFPPSTTPIAISPDGSRVAGHAARCVGFQRYRIDIWNWEQATPEHVVSFEVPQLTKLHEYGWVKWVRFSFDNTLMVYTPWSQLMVFEPDSANVRWQLDTGQPIDEQVYPAVSCNGRYVAVFCKASQSILLIDVKSGQVVNKISQLPFDPLSMQISRDGQYLMAARGRSFKLWSLGDGTAFPLINIVARVRDSVTLPQRDRPENIQQCVLLSYGLVMLDKLIYDGRTGRAIWEYSKLPQAQLVGDMLYDLNLESMPRSLHCWPLLQQQVVDALPKADDVDSTATLNTPVSIDLSDWEADESAKRKMREHLIRCIRQKNHIYSAEPTPLKIKFTTRNGEKHDIHMGYSNGINFTMTYRDRIATLYLDTHEASIKLKQVVRKFNHREIDKEKTLAEIAKEMAAVEIDAFGDFILPDRLTDPTQEPLGQSLFNQN